MAQFWGTIKGARGEASRLGHKSSGLDTYAASWEGAVSVRLWHDPKTGRDMAQVELTTHHGAVVHRSLFRRPVSGATCECTDPGCKAHKSEPTCSKPVYETLYRCDMEDNTGVAFCGDCASDAMESGVFATKEA